MKKILEEIMNLPIWVKIVALCVAMAILAGCVTAAVYLLPEGEPKNDENSTADSTDGVEDTSDSVGDTDGVTEGDSATGEDTPTNEPTETPGVSGSNDTTDPTDEPTETPSQNGTDGSGSEPISGSDSDPKDPEKEPDGDNDPTEDDPTEDNDPTEDDDPTEDYWDDEPTEDYWDDEPTEDYWDDEPTEDYWDDEPTETPTQEPTQSTTQTPTQKPTQSTTQKPTDPEPKPPAANKSSTPSVTLCTQVGPNKMVVAGNCAVDAEYIRVSGDGVTSIDIYPDKSSSKAYFIGTVKYSKSTTVKIQLKQPNKELSDMIEKKIGYSSSTPDYMTSDEYMPVFSKNSRMHFYSALLCYTLSDKVKPNVKNQGKENITEIVNRAKAVGTEVIFLIAPSSAWVYPETVPDEYKKATGETIYQAFKSVAEQSGAKVIYPLDTMLAHKNDGFKIYHNTDSHWSTYGAYWALSDLMNYISKEFPKAKPRTVAEMGFYNQEMYAGDALFSFPDGMGFDRIRSSSSWNGATSNTKMKELAPLYTIKFGTNTLYNIFRQNQSVYLSWGNSERVTVSNGGAGLPTAMVLRDSFGCTIYDMLCDRFSTVWWQSSGEYAVSWTLEERAPDYLIYVVSERNLTKVMLCNENASITNLLK